MHTIVKDEGIDLPSQGWLEYIGLCDGDTNPEIWLNQAVAMAEEKLATTFSCKTISVCTNATSLIPLPIQPGAKLMAYDLPGAPAPVLTCTHLQLSRDHMCRLSGPFTFEYRTGLQDIKRYTAGIWSLAQMIYDREDLSKFDWASSFPGLYGGKAGEFYRRIPFMMRRN